MLDSKVVLILGSGPNIGHHVSQAFVAKGYKVALASRNLEEEDNVSGQTHFQVDLSEPLSVPDLFTRVKESLGLPDVVVYNAAASTASAPNDPFSISLPEFVKDMSINTTSAFVAAQQAVTAFTRLPASASRTFIFTGNCLNTDMVIVPYTSLGAGKSATAHLIHSASEAYADRGFKFYYDDERKADGLPVYGDISGAAHAKHYIELAELKEQGPWQQTFVDGQGYRQFA